MMPPYHVDLAPDKGLVTRLPCFLVYQMSIFNFNFFSLIFKMLISIKDFCHYFV